MGIEYAVQFKEHTAAPGWDNGMHLEGTGGLLVEDLPMDRPTGFHRVDASYHVIGVGPIPDRPFDGLNSVVLVKENGKWLCTAHRNWIPPRPEPATQAERFKAPRIWNDAKLADWALPRAHQQLRQNYVTTQDYYDSPVHDARTYPVYPRGPQSDRDQERRARQRTA